MKRRILMMLMVFALTLSALPVYAAAASFSVTVQADKKDVKPGDTVNFTVVAQGEDVVALQFNLDIPSGMKYVAGSGAVPAGLRDMLKVAAADWTEMSMIFTYYNDVGVTIPKGTVLLTFACTAEAEGTHQVGLYEVLPFNSEFEEFSPSVKTAAVTVTKAGEQGDDTPATSEPVDVTTKPTEEPTTEPTQVVTPPDVVTQPTETTAVTEPEESQATEPSEDTGTDVERTEPTHQDISTEVTQDDPTEDTTGNTIAAQEDPTQESEEKNDPQSDDGDQGNSMMVLWIILGVAAVGAAAVAAVIFLKKKKTA